MPEDKPRTEVARLAAALALLVMPVLVLFGLSALGLASGFFLSIDRLMGGKAFWLFLTT